jgi:hypothetical protein
MRAIRGVMQTELASQTILAQLTASSEPQVSMGQMKVWFTPQKAEHDDDYSINPGYFEGLLRQTVRELLKEGYLESSARDIEDGDAQVFCLTEKGKNYVQELLASTAEP